MRTIYIVGIQQYGGLFTSSDEFFTEFSDAEKKIQAHRMAGYKDSRIFTLHTPSKEKMQQYENEANGITK